MTDVRTKEEIIDWLREKLNVSPRGTAAALAKRLGKNRSVVSEILSGKRNVSGEELILLMEFFGGSAYAPKELREVEMAGGVAVVGRIGENIWTKAGGGDVPTKQTFVGAVVSEYPVEDQSAYILEETTPDHEYRAGDMIYTVPFTTYRSRPLPDDVVVILTFQGGFERFTLRRATAADGGVSLQPLFPDRKIFRPSDNVEAIVGLVIGFFRPQRKI